MKYKILIPMIVMFLLVPLVFAETGCTSSSDCIDDFDRPNNNDLETATNGNTWSQDRQDQLPSPNSFQHILDNKLDFKCEDIDQTLSASAGLELATALSTTGDTIATRIHATVSNAGSVLMEFYESGTKVFVIQVDAANIRNATTQGQGDVLFTVVGGASNWAHDILFAFNFDNQTVDVEHNASGNVMVTSNARFIKDSVTTIDAINISNCDSDGGNTVGHHYDYINFTAAVGTTFNHTLPELNISYPDNYSTLNNVTFPLKINGTIGLQNGTLANVTINSTLFRNKGTNLFFNFTFNGSFDDFPEIEHHMNITANSTAGNQTSVIVIFTFDKTNPAIISSLDGNFTLFNIFKNITFNINFTDNLRVFSFNVSTPEGFLSNDTGLNTTKYIFNGSINVSTYGVGRRNIMTETCDAHTSKKLKDDWEYIKRLDKKIDFENGLLIGPETGTEWEDIIVTEGTYKIAFKYVSKEYMSNAVRRFVVEGRKEVFIYGQQDGYDAWLVVDGARWVDHNLKSQPNAKHKIIRINGKKVVVEISGLYGFELEFDSVGDLNCFKETYQYYLFNYTTSFSSNAIETTKDLIKLTINFEDVILGGNGTLNYEGIDYNTTNFTSTSQLNLSINFSIPQVGGGGNETNTTFFWNINLNGSLFETINYTQLIQRIRLTICGDLTDVATLNITIHNEQVTPKFLEASLDAVFNVWTNDSGNTINFSFALSESTNYTFCLFPNTTLNVDAQIYYNTSGGFREKWFLENARLTQNSSDLLLYNFDDSTGIDDLRGVLRRTTFEFYPDIISSLQRFYPAENVWRTVQMDKSDDFGNVLFHIIEGTQDYRLIFQDENTVVDSTDNLKFLCDTNNICNVNFIVDDTTTTTAAALFYSTGYSNESEMYQLNWTDTTGLTASIRLVMTKETGTSSIPICDSTVSSSSGTINCNTTGYDGTLRARIYKSQSPLTPFVIEYISKAILKLFQTANLSLGEGSLWAIGISSTLIIAGSLINPIMGIIIYIFSLFIINSFGLVNWLTISSISLIGAMGVIIMVLIERGR